MQNRHNQTIATAARPGIRPASPAPANPRAEKQVEFVLNMPQARSAAVAGLSTTGIPSKPRCAKSPEMSGRRLSL
jgi:hypothetical protein